MKRATLLWIGVFVCVINIASSAVARVPIEQDSSEALAKRVEALEQRVRDLETVIETLIAKQPQTPSAPAFGQKFGKGSKASDTKTIQGSVVIKVAGFAPAEGDAGKIAEANSIEAGCAADAQEIKRLQEQKRKLYDLHKELDRRYNGGRGMSDVEYARLMAENKNQRDDIVSTIAGIEDKSNKLKRKAASLRHDANTAGQRIEGVDADGIRVVVTTRFDCAKLLAPDVSVTLVNPKLVNASPTLREYTADKVQLVSP